VNGRPIRLAFETTVTATPNRRTLTPVANGTTIRDELEFELRFGTAQ
jgi:hypothetical protein